LRHSAQVDVGLMVGCGCVCACVAFPLWKVVVPSEAGRYVDEK
jgi:hypothetical protein